MRVAILGATGPTGQCLVQLALTAGREVTAVVRNPLKFSKTVLTHPNFRHATVNNIFSAESLKPGLDGAEVVFSCLGETPAVSPPFTTLTFYTDSARAIVEAMRQLNNRSRLIVLSSACTKYEPENPKILEWFVKPLFIGRLLDDMHRMEQYLESEKDLDFVAVKAPALIGNRAPSGKPILAEESQFVKDNTMGFTLNMPRIDVAKFMLECATEDKWSRKCVAIAV